MERRKIFKFKSKNSKIADDLNQNVTILHLRAYLHIFQVYVYYKREYLRVYVFSHIHAFLHAQLYGNL